MGHYNLLKEANSFCMSLPSGPNEQFSKTIASTETTQSLLLFDETWKHATVAVNAVVVGFWKSPREKMEFLKSETMTLN